MTDIDAEDTESHLRRRRELTRARARLHRSLGRDKQQRARRARHSSITRLLAPLHQPPPPPGTFTDGVYFDPQAQHDAELAATEEREKDWDWEAVLDMRRQAPAAATSTSSCSGRTRTRTEEASSG